MEVIQWVTTKEKYIRAPKMQMVPGTKVRVLQGNAAIFASC